jgi:ribosomal protein S15P/S13E
MPLHNPEMANIAFTMLHRARGQLEKQAFVPADALGGQGAMGQAGPEQAAPADPAAAQAAPQAAPPAPPADPAAAAPAPAPAAAPVDMNMLREAIRQELTSHSEKPKKQSAEERLTSLEGVLLHVLEYLKLREPEASDQGTGGQPAPAQPSGGFMSSGTSGQGVSSLPPEAADQATLTPVAGAGIAGMPGQEKAAGFAAARPAPTGLQAAIRRLQSQVR